MNLRNQVTIKTVILCLVMAVFACGQLFAQSSTKHEVKAGETLYSISHKYGITINDIKAANPKLGDSLMAGQTINIPDKSRLEPAHVIITSQDIQEKPVLPVQQTQPTITVAGAQTQAVPAEDPEVPNCKLTHEVQKKETLYGISQKYGLTVDELVAANPEFDTNKKKLKKGAILCIPFTQAELEALKPIEEEEIIIKEPVPVNLAIIMPFGLHQEKKSREAITMIDFYEGIMLAISELKTQGVSGKVYAFDEADIDSVLTLPQMKKIQLIIGAKELDNINKLKSFTEKNNISLVVPLSSSTSIVNNSHNVYQVNHKMDNQAHDRAFELLNSMNTNANYIFVNIEEQQDMMDNVRRMRAYLTKEGKIHKSIDFKEISTITEMLAEGKENIIIPSSSTKTAFDRLVKKLEELELTSYNIDLFGYADWQAFADKEIETFRKYNCTFFASFYQNPNSIETRTFNQKFYRAFGREQFNTYPRYGMLGYDIANFFVRNMYIEGEDFAANIENLSSNSLQNPMHFTHKNTWSGFINNALMLVRYNTDGTISVKQL